MTTTRAQTAQSHEHIQPSGLSALNLTTDEFAELARQGFISAEFREERGPFFKLRFRYQGRQRVRYLGQDSEHARRIEEELASLQNPRQLELQATRLLAEARQALRRCKSGLQHQLAEAGYTFHGLAIRRRQGGGGHKAPIT